LSAQHWFAAQSAPVVHVVAVPLAAAAVHSAVYQRVEGHTPFVVPPLDEPEPLEDPELEPLEEPELDPLDEPESGSLPPLDEPELLPLDAPDPELLEEPELEPLDDPEPELEPVVPVSWSP
jgi:hypothetical protein